MDVVTLCEQVIRGKKNRVTKRKSLQLFMWEVVDGPRRSPGRDDKWLGLGCICSRTWRTYWGLTWGEAWGHWEKETDAGTWQSLLRLGPRLDTRSLQCLLLYFLGLAWDKSRCRRGWWENMVTALDKGAKSILKKEDNLLLDPGRSSGSSSPVKCS